MLKRLRSDKNLIRKIFVPLILYIGLLVFSANFLANNQFEQWHIAIAASPIIPGIFFALGILNAVQNLDEMERKVLADGIIFSFISTLLLMTNIGLLSRAGIPQLNGVAVGLIMVVLWLIGKLIAMRIIQ